MSDWKYIDEYNSLPATEFIHCDTRDFHILCMEGDRVEIHRTMKGIRHSAGHGTLSDCKFRRDEILGTLKALENESGGKGDWRYLSTKSHPGWIKYIRFVKTAETVDLLGRIEPVYIAYTTCGSTYEVLSRSLLSEEIDKDSLNYIDG